MKEKNANRQIQEIVSYLLECDGKTYDSWLREQLIEVISTHAATVGKALKSNSEKGE